MGADLDEVGVLGIAHGDDGVNLLDELLLLVVVELHVPLGQARLPRAVLDQDEADLRPPPDPKIGRLGSKRGSSAPCLPPDDPTGGLGGVEGPPVPYPIRFPSSLLTDPIRKWRWAAPISPYPNMTCFWWGVSPKKGEFCPPSAPH